MGEKTAGFVEFIQKASDGLRKILLVAYACTLVWVYIMWGPGVSESGRDVAVDVIKWLVVTATAGNVLGDHLAGALAKKKSP